MDTITASYVSRVEKNVVWAKLKEIIIIIAIKQTEEKVFKLNKTATYIWEHCDGKKTVAELIRNMCAEYAVDEATARNDAIEFIEKMQEKQLLYISTSPE
jgi:coenzyme PQQ biosynthesis protein PqqD